MNLAEIIDSQAVLPSLRAQNKKQLLQEIAHAAGKLTAIDHRVIFETLLQYDYLARPVLLQRGERLRRKALMAAERKTLQRRRKDVAARTERPQKRVSSR